MEPVTLLEERATDAVEETPVVVPPAFYRDEEPPEPPEDDPHWREFPIFDGVRNSRLLVVMVVAIVLTATFAHLAILFFI